MTHEYFSPFGTESITIEFDCDSCKNHIITDELGIPFPNFSAEKASDSYNTSDDYTVCDNCGKEFTIYINVGYGDAYVEILDLEDNVPLTIHEIGEEYDEYVDEQIETYLINKNFIDVFNSEISNLRQLNDLDLGTPDLEKTLRRQIYSSAITCLEDYLSTTLINKVLNDDKSFKRFVRTYKGIRNRKFDLSEIFEKQQQLNDVVKKELVDVIYHDLPKVKGMYEDTLEIEFPSIEEVAKIVINRHNMVHRNGKDKEGNEIPITKETVSNVIYEVEKFISELDSIIN